MITLPEATPHAADLRSGGRFLLGVVEQQRRHLIASCSVALVWMLGEAAAPFVLGRTIDAGLLGGDARALVIGCLALFAVIAVTSLVGTWSHRLAVTSWMLATFRTQQQIGYHLADHGPAVSATTTTGEVVETVGSDTHKIGELLETANRGMAAIITFPIVVIVVLRLDVLAGLWIAVGLPLMTVLLAVLVRPLNARIREQRKSLGKLAALGSDTAAGLRVLRGIGGERQFVDRYCQGSQNVRRQGTQVARAWSVVEMAQVGLPGTFIVVLIWLGANGTLSGRLTGGELVTLYGSAAFLRLPLDVMSEVLFDLVSARIASERIVALLRRTDQVSPDGELPDAGPSAASVVPVPAPSLPLPALSAELTDPPSGVRLGVGQLTALVSAIPEQANAIVEGMAGLAPNQAQLGGIPLARLAPGDVHRRIQFSEAEPRLFSGTLRRQLDPAGRHEDDDIVRALAAADAMDVLDALPEGLDTEVEERGRGFSGGQRQRIALARALLAGAEVLLLIEPTSAVDAHTEARVAQRLGPARRGRTTLVTTASPLLLQECDRVLFLRDGHVAAAGTHHQLMDTSAAYRSVVIRDLSVRDDQLDDQRDDHDDIRADES